MGEAASTLLILQAAELSVAIFGAFKSRRLTPSDLEHYRIAHCIAVKLHLIVEYLISLPPYWIEQEVEQHCSMVLRDLQNITQPPRKSTYPAFLFKWNQETDLETRLVAFFKERTDDARKAETTCAALLSTLTNEDNTAVELPDSALKLNAPTSSDDVENSIFEALQLIASCDPKLHERDEAALASQLDLSEFRHAARLCLHETESQDSAPRGVAILVSATDQAIWQEFCLKMRLGDIVDNEQRILNQGGFCEIIENNCSARLILEYKRGHGLSLLGESQVLSQIIQAGPGISLKSVIDQYELTPKDKVFLSYAIAQAYWKYYDSELMQIKWTSDVIWFMCEEGGSGREDQLALRAYISLPSSLDSSTAPEVEDEVYLTHRCPRIFDLGVLLLEIGQARPFRILGSHNKVRQANLNHKRALDELYGLERVDWDGFTNKKHFDAALKFCLNRNNFLPPKQLNQTQQGFVESKPAWYGEEGIRKRRRMLYKHVVRPLTWLAESGFGLKSGDLTYVSKRPDSSLQRGAFDMKLGPDPGALFHSNIRPMEWLADLKKISGQIERQRRQHRVTTPVRVAILDTGINRDFDVFRTKSGLIESIKDEQDFVNPIAPTAMDTFGHGTFMARLIMECAPGAQILVARVAENTDTLKISQDNIRKASMMIKLPSSGLGRPAMRISFLCLSVSQPTTQGYAKLLKRFIKIGGGNIIFFASAGNLSIDDESFPARHPNVISVQATNCHGKFSQSNSASTTDGAAVLGTYGDDIPDFIYKEFSTTYPKFCQPGSSVATAIMAGIGAIMLAYEPVLSSLASLQGMASISDRVLKHLRTAKGMEAVLQRLAQDNLDHPRLKAVKPMWFWKSRPSDQQRCFAIIDFLSAVDRRSPMFTNSR